jgi:hypothetical protein
LIDGEKAKWGGFGLFLGLALIAGALSIWFCVKKRKMK